MSIKAASYKVTCDMCGRAHKFQFPFEPNEDALNNLEEEFDFEPYEHCWELHTEHSVFDCYCRRHGFKPGVWCDECADKFWAIEMQDCVEEAV